MGLLDIFELLIELGKTSGVIPMEIIGSCVALLWGIKGYKGSKDGTDLIESGVNAGSVFLIIMGLGGLLTVVLQVLNL